MERETFEVVCWPDIQSLFNIEEFRDNAYLINDEKGLEDFGSGAYFIRSVWLKSHAE